ncbi:cellulase family glycosylhydrolase [Endozoicomonas ascidiicola]|uniref:cellulase family glycosylhydrolase n=1 Tax=Endozoicomonas ascidiicola TaxID=1698521 RepID=UPI00083170A0|nr:cellulase family glycosylhydrolase [Endozoicomonas ascidiicola]
MKRKLLSCALAGFMYSSLAHSAPLPDDDWLHVEGNQIVDIDGQPVWLTGANWFGFNATERTFHGLWSVNLETTVQSIAERGINLLRVPISTELLYEWSQGQASVPNVNTSTNPNLVDKTDLEIFDHFLAVAKQYGVKVMLDVHSAEADNSGHVYTMWYKGQITPEIFYSTWEWVTARYVNDDTILAMDIENEPHGKPWADPEFAKWDDSTDINNWKYACETASNRILAINPNMLVLCEGIESYPIDGITWTAQTEDDYHNNWWGGNLQGVRDFPIDLGDNQDQLVYSPHDYGPLVYQQPWFYEGFNKQTLYEDVWKDNWMFIHEEEIAPLLIGEWGGFMDGGDNEKWMVAIRDLIIENKLHHTFWCINPNSGDTGGLLNNDWTTWDEAKYALFEPSLWRAPNGKFIGLDHQVPLGNATVGTTVTDYYASLSPSVGIKSPEAGTVVLTGQPFDVRLSRNKVAGVNAYINGAFVASSADTTLSLTAPTTEQNFTVTLKGTSANGTELDITDSIALQALDSLPATITISAPDTVESGKDFSIDVVVENAAGYQAEFEGQTTVVMDQTSTVFTAPIQLGSYPITISAVDAQQQPLGAIATTSIDVVALSLSCSSGTENIWNSGFVLNNVQVTNTTSKEIKSWSVELVFPQDVTLVNGWNATLEQVAPNRLKATSPSYSTLQPGSSHSFGMQGGHGGSFASPECVVN